MSVVLYDLHNYVSGDVPGLHMLHTFRKSLKSHLFDLNFPPYISSCGPPRC